MRMPFTISLAAVAILSVIPRATRSQADPNLKLSSSNTQAVSEFRAGVTDYENLSREAAAAHFQAAINADPNFGLARVMYVASTGVLTPSQVEAELNRGVADAARASTNELLLALTYRESILNHPQAANAIGRATAELMPSDRSLAFGASRAADNRLPALREFVTRNPDYAPAYNNLAYQLWQAGDRTAALAAAKRQVELNPKAPNPHDTYAELLQWNGNFPQAIQHYQDATKLSPKFPEAFAGLAEVEAAQGHYDQARAYLNQAIANAWTPQQKLGYMREILGTYALQSSPTDVTKQLEAIAAEAKAQNNARATAVTYAQLAASYANAGNVAASHKSLEMANAASSEVPWPVYYFGTMSHGMMKHWAPANQELTALKARAATDPTVSKAQLAAAEGYLLTQQGRPADALNILMAADTTDVLVMNRIAEAHAALGHASVAAAWNNRVSSNYALSLGDFPAINARRRARMELTTPKKR